MIVAMQIKGIATERKQTTIKKNRSINDSFVFFFVGIGFIVFNYWNNGRAVMQQSKFKQN